MVRSSLNILNPMVGRGSQFDIDFMFVIHILIAFHAKFFKKIDCYLFKFAYAQLLILRKIVIVNSVGCSKKLWKN